MDAAKPNASMKTIRETSVVSGPGVKTPTARYQVYQQNRVGLFLPGYRTDAASEVVEAFLHQAPAFDGGGIRLFDHRDQRMVASVEWRTEKTDFGFPVHHRVNRFHDAVIEQLAQETLARESLRESVRHSLLAGV
jgi:hypothetical protein